MPPIRSLAALALVAAASIGFARANDPQMIASDGTVHRVFVSSWTSSGGTVGTALRHQIQSSGGSKQTLVVPGTDDPATERSPVLGIDPLDDSVYLVWVREEAGSTHLRISRWSDGAWSSPAVLDGPRAGASSPSLRVESNWLHVAWSEAAGQGPTFWRGVFRKDGFGREYGPEALPTDMPIVPAAGAGPSEAPTSEGLDAFFSYVAPGPGPSDRGRLYVWGIRDEPVPIGYAEGLELTVLGSDTRNQGVRGFRSHMTIWFHTADRFFYRTRSDGTWNAYRVVLLDSQTSPEAARLQVEEMLRRR